MKPSTLEDLIHDLRQPLSNIEAQAYYLESLLASQPELCSQVRALREQVDCASRMLMEASQRATGANLPLTNAAISVVMY